MNMPSLNLNKSKTQSKLRSLISKVKDLYFNLNFLLIKEQSSSCLFTIILTIIQYLQIISFPWHSMYSEYWNSTYYFTISKIINYSNIFYIFENNTILYLSLLIVISLFLIVVSLLILYSMHRLSQFKLLSKAVLSIIVFLYSFNNILAFPILKMYLVIFRCTSENVNYYFSDIKCNVPFHYILMTMSGMFFLVTVAFTFVIRSIFYNNSSASLCPSAKISSICAKYFFVLELVLLVIYEFFSSYKEILAIFTLWISITLLYNYTAYQPYYNKLINHIVILWHSFFLWSCLVLISVFWLSSFNFTGGPVILVIGYVLILSGHFIYSSPYTVTDMIFKASSKMTSWDYLKHINLYISLIGTHQKWEHRKDNIMLYSFIRNSEITCFEDNCPLKQYWNDLVIRKENQEQNKEYLIDNNIYLFKHAESMFKTALSKYPKNVQLRWSYSNFWHNQINKKKKAYSEIEIANCLDVNFEDEFFIYKTKTEIKEELENHCNNTETINHNEEEDNTGAVAAFKTYFANFKSNIIKVSIMYIDFWSLLSMGEESKMKNFSRISELGNRINKWIVEINDTLKKMERINENDRETVKIYANFLSEVINNKKKADRYLKKLSDIEEGDNKYDEICVGNANWTNWEKNHDFQYIIASARNERFGEIINASLSLCGLLGYTKTEMIGKNINILIPELYTTKHDTIWKKTVADYRTKKLSLKKDKPSEPSRFKEMQCYAKTNAKYIIPLRLNVGLFSDEEGEDFFICKLQNASAPEQAYNQSNQLSMIWTDPDLIIQNFTPNSAKLLNLYSGAINSWIDISEFVKELKEDYWSHYWEAEEGKDNEKKRKIIRNVINKKYRLPSEVTWIPNESIINSNQKSKNNDSFILMNDKIAPNQTFISSKGAFSSSNKDLQGQFHINPRAWVRKRVSVEYINFIVNNKHVTNNNNNNQWNDKFYLSIEDAKIGDCFVGYLFKIQTSALYTRSFQSPKSCNNLHPLKQSNHLNMNNLNAWNINQSCKNSQINLSINNSWMNSFSKEKKENFFLDGTYIPSITSLYHFNWDLNSMSFTQKCSVHKESMDQYYFDENTPVDWRVNLKNMALKWIKQITEEQGDLSTSNTFSEEYSSNSGESYSSSTSSSVENKNKGVSEQTPQEEIAKEQQVKSKGRRGSSNIRASQIHTDNIWKEFDYYHVKTAKVRLWVYNYHTQCVEEQPIPKDRQYNEVELKTTMRFTNYTNKGDVNLKNYIESAEQSGANTNTSGVKKSITGDDSINEWDRERKMWMKQIKISLRNKETQPTIRNLMISSFIEFIIVLALVAITLFDFLSGQKVILQNTVLILKSAKINKIFLHNIFLIRELILTAQVEYTNIYDNDKERYFSGLNSEIKDSFFEITDILSSLSINSNEFSEEIKQTINNNKVIMDVLDAQNPLKYKTYHLSSFASLNEINFALYHIMGLTAPEVKPWEENIYYFMRNTLNNIFSVSMELSSYFLSEFIENTFTYKLKYIIKLVWGILWYIAIYSLMIMFYSKVENKKNSYLAVFYEWSSKMIVNSITKCEKFSQNIQMSNDLFDQQECEILSSSSEDIEAEAIYGNDNRNAKRQSEGIGIKANSGRFRQKNMGNKIKIFLLIIILISLTVGLYVVLIVFQNNYNHYAYYLESHSDYQFSYSSVFIYWREYMYDSEMKIENQSSEDVVNGWITNMYSIMWKGYEELDQYSKKMPTEFIKKYTDWRRDSLCVYLDEFNIENSNAYSISADGSWNCDTFASGILTYGFVSTINYYIEQNRIIYHSNEAFHELKNEANLEHYLNNTWYGTDYYLEHLPPETEPEKRKIFYEANTVELFNTDIHKEMVIIYRFIIHKFVWANYNLIETSILNIYAEHMIVVVSYFWILSFALIASYWIFWIPFVWELNETIYQTKNMLVIIPRELLVTMPQTKAMLGLNDMAKTKESIKL